MKFPFVALCLALWLGVGPHAALAERADRNQPMQVEADALRYDDLRQTSVFTGRVVLTKGSILIRGARVELRQDPQGYQSGTVLAEPGALAYFRQKRDGVDETIEGVARTIEYDGRSDQVKFIGNAQMRRFRGAVLSDETSGSVITYDNLRDVFSVDGAAATGSTQSRGRVRAVIAPRVSASAPPAPTAPAASLRADPTLSEPPP